MIRLPRFITSIWARVSEPRVLSAISATIYALLGVGGMSALILPPRSIAGQIGDSATAILAGMLVYAALLGIPAALSGVRWLEWSALLASIIGLSIYAVITVTLHISESGNRILQASVICAMILMLISRWVRIRATPYDPDRHHPRTGQTPTIDRT